MVGEGYTTNSGFFLIPKTNISSSSPDLFELIATIPEGEQFVKILGKFPILGSYPCTAQPLDHSHQFLALIV